MRLWHQVSSPLLLQKQKVLCARRMLVCSSAWGSRRSDTTTHLRERKNSKALPYSLAWLMDTETTSPANAKKLISTSFHRKGSTLIFPFVFFSLQAQLVQNPLLTWLSTARDQAQAVSAGAERSPGAGAGCAAPTLLSLAKCSN